MRVCYVSGDPDTRDRIASGLGDCDDLEVTTVATADAAVELLDATTVDCVVTDHRPPQTAAPAVVESLHTVVPACPVVVFTDDGSEAVASDAFAAGAAGYLRDDGTYETLAARIRDLVDRPDSTPTGDRERMFSTLVSNLPGMAYRCHNEAGWPMEFVSDGARDLAGYSPDRIEAGEISWGADVIHPADRERVFDTVQRAVDDDEPFTLTYRIVTADDEEKWVWERGRQVEDGPVDEPILEGFITDITEQKRREAQLEALNDLAGTLTATNDVSEVCTAAVDAAQETLDLELAAVERYDETAGELVPCARTDAVSDLVGEDPLFAGERDQAWETYVESDGTIFEDISARSDVETTGTELDSAIVLPLGRHGVFIAGSTTPVSFEDPDIDLARILAAHAETAFDRLEREQSLRSRTETLQRRTERLERADRIAETLRALVADLPDASTREAIETAACQRLVERLPVSFVWTGSEDPVSSELEPTARAGLGDGYLESIAPSAATDAVDPEPSVQAYRTQEPHLVEEIRAEPPMAGWREESLVRSWRSVLAVPITHANTRYGVLVAYSETADAFGGRERTVLDEIGSFVGYVITATERKRSLSTDSVVELEFQATDPEQGLPGLLASLGGTVEFRGLVTRTDGSIRAFLTRPAQDPEAVEAAVADTPGVSDSTREDSDDGVRYEVTTSGEGLLGSLVEHGVRLRTLSVEGESVRFVVELPANRDVREFAETVERGPHGATLVARRERAEPRRGASGFRAQISEILSDRQLEALKTAYFGGFFESPRAKTGEEVASLLDVSQPTFNRHLRAGQATVFEWLFEE